MVKRIQSMRGKNGTKVTVVQDKFGKNMPDGAAAAFDPDTGIIYVRNNPTYLELFHESAHAKQWLQQGGKVNYRGNYSSLAREEFVFQEIMNNKHLFTPEEILRSQRVIFKYRNGAWPEDIIGPNWRPDPSDVSFWKGVDPESLPKPTGATTVVDGPDAMPDSQGSVEPLTTSSPMPTKKLSKKHRDYDAEIDRRANLPEGDPQRIDLETADELKRYNHSTDSGGTRDIDSVIEDINDGKTLDPTTSRYGDPDPNVSKRKEYMGATPRKDSDIGLEVKKKMEADGYYDPGPPEMFKSVTDNEWYDIELADMSHKPRNFDKFPPHPDAKNRGSAVEYWNSEGKTHGPKSKEVRDFMNNKDNYYLEHKSYNRSDGAKMGLTYDDPL